jgi:hypothetical protein
MRKEGWLSKQVSRAEADIKQWPEWMRKAASIEGPVPGQSDTRLAAAAEGPPKKATRHRKLRARLS